VGRGARRPIQHLVRLRPRQQVEAPPVFPVVHAWCEFLAALLLLHKVEFRCEHVGIIMVRKQPLFPKPLSIVVSISDHVPVPKGRYIAVGDFPPEPWVGEPSVLDHQLTATLFSNSRKVCTGSFTICPQCAAVGFTRNGSVAAIGCGCLPDSAISNMCPERIRFALAVASGLEG
jgi:hypothetical protein